ncbi:hypothetical protein GCM10009788_06970 [Nocardioides humi]|uniref:Uncharacterized protein n=1 Tax=Nocardioides humi TaxID=449461 RepID=A0ABN1ZW09_9ACTN
MRARVVANLAGNVRLLEQLGPVSRCLLADAGIADADLVTRQLAVLYDGAMASAHAEPGEGWAHAGKEAARVLVEAARTP